MHVGKKALHFGLLVFTAFWLIATSAPPKPARDCFVPLERDTISVTLGPARPTAGPDAAPSCQSIDGLAEGSVLSVRLSRGAKAPEVRHGACWSYEVTQLEGPRGLTDLKSLPENSPLFDCEATITTEQCSGDYRLNLNYDGPIRDGKPVDVLHPAKNDRWYVRRLIRVPEGKQCQQLPTLPNGYCEDTFEVKGVTDAS
jgi:hypothetical protein